MFLRMVGEYGPRAPAAVVVIIIIILTIFIFKKFVQTGQRICYGGKTADKTCRLLLFGNKINILCSRLSQSVCGAYKPHADRTSNRRICPFCSVEIFEHAQNFPPDKTDITGHRRTRSGFTDS